ncbi:hypothetical protein GCM10010517_43270 [Streptosporangium fragile]|uniref:Uncharacterized protein n=1 Tax=Streptosporangium fragile TaxID=46186 RepID=A0ABN3W1X7_9ACTN
MPRRDLRNNRYERADDRPLPGAGLAVRLWRWRTEIALLAGGGTAAVTVAGALRDGDPWPLLVLLGATAALATSRYGRSWSAAHAWCLVSRHRIQRVCLETRMHTRSGRIPLILWITPSAAGEKALVLTRAGICAEDFAAFSGEIASACYAREVVVARHRHRAHLVLVEVIRRPEGPGPVVGLDRFYGRANWSTLHPSGAAQEEPDTGPGTKPFPLAA